MSRRVDPKRRALEVCLQGIQAGVDAEELLASYPKWSAELRPLLQSAQAARSLSLQGQVPEMAQERSRADFLQVAQRMIPRSPRTWLLGLARLGLSFLIVALALALVAGGVLALASLSQPGGLLYPLKRTSEQARLELTRDPVRRLELELAFDRQHLAEVHSLVQRQRSAAVDFSAGLSQIQGNDWLVGEVRVVIPSDARIVGTINPGFYIHVQGNLQADGIVLAQQVQPRDYLISGVLQSLTSEQLVIEGLTILITPETIQHGEPAPGNQVEVWALLTLNQALQARLVEVLD